MQAPGLPLIGTSNALAQRCPNLVGNEARTAGVLLPLTRAKLLIGYRGFEMQSWSPSGLNAIPHLHWGCHLAHFFGSGDELRDVLVPYFKAGLENNERCLWVTGEAFDSDQARAALRIAVPDLDKRERDQQIEIANSSEWYSADQKLRPGELVAGLLQREQDALGLGYAGLRTNGNCAWVSADQWPDFQEYETLVQKAVRERRLICMCSYCVDQMQHGSPLEVIVRHDMAMPGAFQSPPRARDSRNRERRRFDIAMIASQMGTWRYTFADNICTYDKNAQRLYGLTEARFVHSEQGVKTKFHPDDLELMWSRVAKAVDPGSDGRYDVEYRVKQLDGSWRWLSAWGLVEFEGDGSERKPVAITGASRDLTERKQAEELQRLLLHELNYRVKNTLATIQALTAQTLRTASDLPSAREALEHRLRSISRPEGRVSVQWGVKEGMLQLEWEESDGPAVAAPTHKGFGSRLLEELVIHDLGGAAKINYAASGVRCNISARL